MSNEQQRRPLSRRRLAKQEMSHVDRDARNIPSTALSFLYGLLAVASACMLGCCTDEPTLPQCYTFIAPSAGQQKKARRISNNQQSSQSTRSSPPRGPFLSSPPSGQRAVPTPWRRHSSAPLAAPQSHYFPVSQRRTASSHEWSSPQHRELGAAPPLSPQGQKCRRQGRNEPVPGPTLFAWRRGVWPAVCVKEGRCMGKVLHGWKIS